MIALYCIMFTLSQLRRCHSPADTGREIDLLLAESVKKNTTFLDVHPAYQLSLIEYIRFHWFKFQYWRGYSVAAIVGHKEFFGLDFSVNRYTLIPRPDTELLVENTLPLLTKDTLLVDIGTGSGCIPISILKTLPFKTDQPLTEKQNIKTIAVDISSRALRVAKKNAFRHNVKIQFLGGNLLASAAQYIQTKNYGQIIITANLPYLTKEQVASEPSVRREPKSALIAAASGLARYRELFSQLKNIKPVKPTTILCEIDPSQTERMIILVKNFFPDAVLKIKKNLAGRDRLVVVTLTASPQ